jgi:polysaccharide pyruvyl transferase WcaK-like protein
MKIGVVTFWHGNDNYGMILQCWALQEYLKKQGHEPFVIRYKMIGCFAKRIVKQLVHVFKKVVDSSYRNEMKELYRLKCVNAMHFAERDFEGFRNKNIRFSNREYHYIEKLRLFPPQADCYICGSDQIWNGDLKSRNLAGFFLQFGPPEIKRIAYAPSFGMTNHNGKQIEILRKYLMKFDAVSCREWAGVEMCMNAGIDAVKVEDPTLLLSAEDYSDISSNKLYDNYIFIYSLNIEKPENIYYEKLISLCQNKRIVVTPASGFIPGREIFGETVTYNYATPAEWLSLIRYSDLVVTSSFHGVVLSIIFNRKFAFIPLKGEYAKSNNRVCDLIKQLGLEVAIVKSSEDYYRILSNDFDWFHVNISLCEIIKKSVCFLNTSLN